MREDRVLFVFALVKYTNIGGNESVIKIMLEACFGQKKAKLLAPGDFDHHGTTKNDQSQLT